MIEHIDDPKIEFSAALYFLDGHYLFRRHNEHGWANKFVTAEDLRAAFSGQEQDTGWLPAGVVRAGSNASGPFFVYSAPEQKMQVWLDDEQIEIPLPRTVLVGNGDRTWMFALAGKHFFAGDIAMRAPFPNVDGNGLICWGQNQKPTAEPARAREIWSLFFAAPFNDHLANGKCVSQDADVRVLLRKLGQRKARVFPSGELVGTRCLIGNVIEILLEVHR